MKNRKTRCWAVTLSVALLLLVWNTAGAGTVVVMATSTRTAEEGTPIKIPFVLTGPEDPEFLLVQMPPGNGSELVRREGDRLLLGYGDAPWIRIGNVLAEAGVALMTIGAPSDRPKGIDKDWRRDPHHIEDVRCVVRYARQKFPRAHIYVVGSGEALTSILYLARANPPEPEGYIIIGGTWSVDQNEVYAEKKPFLVLNATNHQCPPADFYDAKDACLRNGLTLIEAGYSDTEPNANCKGLSHHGLVGLDREFGKVIVDWLKGKPIPQRIGELSTENDLREEVHYFGSTNLAGKTNRLQMTLFLPAGKGPFPLVVFNHGDILPKAKWQTQHLRYTKYNIYHTFLSLGVAVALPARAGVGKSEGEYYRTTSGDLNRNALTKPRINAPDVLAAVSYLRNLPCIDRDNIVLAGTSSGGITSLYIASQSPAWLRGVINFSGGVTDVATKAGDTSHLPTSLNGNMVNGLKILGISSHIPTLWLYTENDSHYSIKTIKASHEAYTKAGGIATLKLLPPVKGEDGHVFVGRHPEMWAGEVKAFLDSLGPRWSNRQGSNRREHEGVATAADAEMP